MINLERSELASMYTEAMNQLDGLAQINGASFTGRGSWQFPR
jgi:hypothetical protein